MFKFYLTFFLIVLAKTCVNSEEAEQVNKCEPTVTTVSGVLAPSTLCKGDLIFEDNFDFLDFKKWKHESTLSGGGNWEFQWYTNNRSNSYVKNGNLYITPTLTEEIIGEQNLYSMTLDINGGNPAEYCTDLRSWGCIRTGTPTNILNPIRSAKLTTVDSFSFKYGKLQVRAKLPTGDWLWPAIWLLSRYNGYGGWPTSGEIDLMESRGNEYLNGNGVNMGVEQVESTLHWGPTPAWNRHQRTHFAKNSQTFNKEFKVYELEWTPDSLIFRVDGEHLGTVQPGTSFWNFGELWQSGMSNPWQYASNLAPFDQEFYLIMNLAVGGTSGFFPDEAQNNPPKPWINSSPQAYLDFWNARSQWLATWRLWENNGERASLQVDYVKVWAL